MTDYIDRQAAIDALCKAGCGSGYCGVSCDDVKAIEQLQSAEVEPVKHGRWIPVSERLPEPGQEVLVTRHFLSDNQLKKNAITESFYVEVASRIDDEWTSYSDEYKIKRHLHKVIAWMPLPEPYAEEGEAHEID